LSKDKARDIDTELAELDTEEERLKAEALGLEPIPSWQDVQKCIASLEQRELRKGLLPKLQRSLQIRRKELEIQRLESRIEPIVQRQSELSDGLEERREEARQLREEVDRRGGELQASVHQVSNLRSSITRLQREINDLKGA
jgi:hypothetical protein